MHVALEKATFEKPVKDAFWEYVYGAAQHMVNK
jgi:hemoglobin